MNYRDAIAAAVAQRQRGGTETIQVNLMLLAGLADRLAPDQLTAANGNIRWKGILLTKASDLAAALAVPGVRWREPLHLASGAEVPAANLGGFATSALLVSVGAAWIDEEHRTMVQELGALWDSKLARLSFFTAVHMASIRAGLAFGLLPFPITEAQYASLFPALPLALRAPDLTGDKQRADWAAIVGKFKGAVQAFDARNLVVAAAAVDAAAADVQFWDDVYGVTEALAAPYTAVKEIVGGVGVKNLIYLGLLGVALVVAVPYLPLLRKLVKA